MEPKRACCRNLGNTYRTAVRAKARAAKRRARERQVDNMPHPGVPATEAQDWRPLFDQELHRLPDSRGHIVSSSENY